MDPNSDKLYPSVDDARADGVVNPVELRGREEDIRRISADVAKAETAALDDSHPCPKDGCPRMVRRNLLACRDHWALVSPDTKREVYAAYRGRRADITRHVIAVQTAVAEMNA